MTGAIPDRKKAYDKLSVIMVCLSEAKIPSQPGLPHLFHTLLSPKVNTAQKEQVLSSRYSILFDATLGKELKQMCNLSEAIEEKGIEKGRIDGITLTKKALKLSAEGLSPAEIARHLHISIELVETILEDEN